MKLLSKLLSKIKNSTFGKNVVLIAGGAAFAQVLNALLSTIITRIYSPEQYGVLTAFTAILGILSISASLDYQNAIPIAEDDDEAINVFALSSVILLLIVLLITTVLALFGDSLLQLLDKEAISSYKYLIPVGVLLTGLYKICLQWNYRERNYKIISKTRINQSIASNATKLTMGLMKCGSIGLILAYIISESSGITTLFSTMIKKKKSLFSKLTLQRIKYVMKRYRKFPIYSAPNNYIYTVGIELPIILLTSFFGTSVAGSYGLANSVTSMPMVLIGNSISQVFYSEAAKIGRNNPQKIKNLALKLMKQIALIGLIPLVALILFGPSLFSFVFGQRWYDAGVYSQVLSIVIYFHFVITPINRVLEIFERQRDSLLLNLVRLIMIVLVFVFVKLMNLNSFQAIALYSISNSIIYIVLIAIVMRVINSEIKRKER